MELTTEQGNKIIAEFMGGDWYFHNDGKYKFRNIKPAMSYTLEMLRYHSSWDWLMPVVEKIESINHPYQSRFGVYICGINCTIQSTNFRSDIKSNPPYYYFDHYGETKIQAAWLAVVAFFKWYNSLPDNQKSK